MFKIDVIGARHGDCLILHYGDTVPPKRILIDGGPSKVYRQHLRPRLKEIRKEDGLGEPVEFELGMLSHVDADHIVGLLNLTDEMIEQEESDRDPARIKRFWHNSFSDITGSTDTAALASVSDAITASASAGGRVPFAELDGSDGRAEHILASIRQGTKLRDNLEKMGLDGNRPLGGMALQGKDATIHGMKLEVIGPDREALERLQKKWDPNLDPAEIAGITDRSVANLSSIVVLVTFAEKTLLLTGDARGDDIVEWLEQTGHKEPGKPFHVNVLKMPHHGSDRNVDDAFFKAMTADVYVYCGDGHHDNPDAATLEMMRNARDDADYKVIFSNFIRMQHEEKQPEFVRQIRALTGKGIVVDARDNDDHHVEIDMMKLG